jgi:hypothetical protein
MKRNQCRDSPITRRGVAKARGFSPAKVSIFLINALLASRFTQARKKKTEEAGKRFSYRPTMERYGR